MNPEVSFTLEDAVAEVLGILTGLDLQYDPNQDRFQSIVRSLNRALRSMALEKEWSYYSSVESVGTVEAGTQSVDLRGTVRPRIINDDAVRLTNSDGAEVVWAYFLPRDALHKYRWSPGLWCSVTRNRITFSRPFGEHEAGLEIMVPVMREPTQFRLPKQSTDPEVALVDVPASTLNQLLDFPYPDVVILRAAFYVAQTDPVMQPRVQTIEAQYKDLMYQIIEREDRNTDSPFLNGFEVPIVNGITGSYAHGGHPHSTDRP